MLVHVSDQVVSHTLRLSVTLQFILIKNEPNALGLTYQYEDIRGREHARIPANHTNKEISPTKGGLATIRFRLGKIVI